ncbi:DUF3800 domain-containing protein [Microbacterium suaedae]|uniref:DUF3800 domain-containing protein n=1 Tax=Microbacterium suaedae TaxID=2067813 RepID=UPI000DA1D064|nr:DUF3800 domain-containing protein [Microbacterium suaedae]
MATGTDTDDPLIIACDESGNDGENNLSGNSSVFVHASVAISEEVAQALIDEVRARTHSRTDELKSKTILQPKNQAVAQWLLQHPELEGRCSLVLVHKQFFTVSKLFDSTAEEMLHSLGEDMYENGAALCAATILFFAAPGAFGRQWPALLHAFEAFLRSSDAVVARQRLGALVARFIDIQTTSDSPILDFVGMAFAGIEHLEQLSQFQLGEGIAERLRTADPLLAGVGGSINEWKIRSGRPVSVVHDEAKELTPARIEWLKDSLRHPERVAASMAGTGVDVADFILVDSRLDARVQVADLLAGLGRVVAEDIVRGKEHPLLSGVGSLQSRFSVWPVRDHMDPHKARATISESRQLLVGD